MNNTQINKAILDEDLYALDTLLKDRSGCFSFIRFALQNGKVKSFLYLYERGHADGFYTIELFDNFALLQAAVEGGYRMDRDEFSCSTVIRKFPTLEVLQFCHQHSFHHWGHKSIANAAAASGNVEMLRYCFNNGCQMTSADDAVVRADLVYEIEDIQYENIVSEAAMSGNLDCLKYAIYLGGAINWVALCKAAEKGHKHIIKYLLSIGCGVNDMCT